MVATIADDREQLIEAILGDVNYAEISLFLGPWPQPNGGEYDYWSPKIANYA